jgi:hypothetical protein
MSVLPLRARALSLFGWCGGERSPHLPVERARCGWPAHLVFIGARRSCGDRVSGRVRKSLCEGVLPVAYERRSSRPACDGFVVSVSRGISGAVIILKVKLPFPVSRCFSREREMSCLVA